VLGDWSDMVARARRGELHGLAVSASHPERADRFLFSASPYSTHKSDLPRSNPRKPRPVMIKIAVSDFTRVATSRPATSSVSLPAPASACCSDRTRRH
jgi:hypothetical protein